LNNRDGTTGRTLIGTRQSYDEIFDFVRHTIDMSEFTFASSQPGQVQEIDQFDETKSDRPWIVIVWNDPINLMSYVTFVFQKLFGYSLEKATELMLDVHHKGRAVVSSGSRERAEFDVYRLHEHGLWATLEHESL
jgi:ATP-dependent Clp protease adaptor protein ClpS